MSKDRNPNYFILAGAPGTGKTATLNYLLQLGFNCCEEAARKVLVDQLAKDGPALPSKALFFF